MRVRLPDDADEADKAGVDGELGLRLTDYSGSP